MSKIWYNSQFSVNVRISLMAMRIIFRKHCQKIIGWNTKKGDLNHWFGTSSIINFVLTEENTDQGKTMMESRGNKRNLSRVISLIYNLYKRFSDGMNNLRDAKRNGRPLPYGKNTPYLLRCDERQDVLR